MFPCGAECLDEITFFYGLAYTKPLISRKGEGAASPAFWSRRPSAARFAPLKGRVGWSESKRQITKNSPPRVHKTRFFEELRGSDRRWPSAGAALLISPSNLARESLVPPPSPYT